MQVAPGISHEEWKKLDFGKPDAWDLGVTIFERRIKGRFFDAVDCLLADDEPRRPHERRWGFAILTLDCLLVETLEAFRKGLTNTKGKSKDLCVEFLTTRSAFKGFFSQPLATRFYYEFRCGLAHNAQTFGTGLIWSIGPLLQVNGTQITVNRTAFHQALLTELKQYTDELRAGTDLALRQSFRTKMDFIADAQF